MKVVYPCKFNDEITLLRKYAPKTHPILDQFKISKARLIIKFDRISITISVTRSWCESCYVARYTRQKTRNCATSFPFMASLDIEMKWYRPSNARQTVTLSGIKFSDEKCGKKTRVHH